MFAHHGALETLLIMTPFDHMNETIEYIESNGYRPFPYGAMVMAGLQPRYDILASLLNPLILLKSDD